MSDTMESDWNGFICLSQGTLTAKMSRSV